MALMSPALLRELCKKDALYQTPSLNDKLYLHYKGFREVASLEPYTGLRVLWLEGNGLPAIQGLDAQVDMRTLYLQENCIERIENLAHMVREGGRAQATPPPAVCSPPHAADGVGCAQPLAKRDRAHREPRAP